MIKHASENVIQNLLIEQMPVCRIEILREAINDVKTNVIKAKHREAKNTLVGNLTKIRVLKTLGPIKINAMKIIVPTTV